jgi:glycerophosphoryl diester phosphodiesterase
MKILGHRGWRGKYPENSLIGFDAVSRLAISGVELDVIINKKGELLVSHEPWFDLAYCQTKEETNLFRLATESIQQVDCGTKFYPNFPNQLKLNTVKPLFSSLVAMWNYLEVKPFIALEVKSETKRYGSYQSFAKPFAEALIKFEKDYLKGFDYFVQSFDPYFLKVYHQLKLGQETGLLVENKIALQEDLDFLGYRPNFYNPEHLLLEPTICQQIIEKGMEIYTWTVNQKDLEHQLSQMGVTGLISDYPELFVAKDTQKD